MMFDFCFQVIDAFLDMIAAGRKEIFVISSVQDKLWESGETFDLFEDVSFFFLRYFSFFCTFTITVIAEVACIF